MVLILFPSLPQLWTSQGDGEAHTPEVHSHLQKTQGSVWDEDTLSMYWGDEPMFVQVK